MSSLSSMTHRSMHSLRQLRSSDSNAVAPCHAPSRSVDELGQGNNSGIRKLLSKRDRKNSASNLFSWLSGPSTSTSTSAQPFSSTLPYGTERKPTRVVEPKQPRRIDLLGLGHGAMVVTTPDEALRDSGVRVTPDGFLEQLVVSPILEEMPVSPELPPLPLSDDGHDAEALVADVLSASFLSERVLPTPPPSSLAMRPSLKSNHSSRPVMVFPPVPSHLPPAPLPPPFKALLLSAPPAYPLDPSNTMVVLETATQKHRTLLSTLTSRPSNLTDYLNSVVPSDVSLGSPSSAYSDNYEEPRFWAGPSSCTTATIHIFLDRPSAPYEHILTYLRTPSGSIDSPGLPRAAQLQCSTIDRLRMLLDLRDEATYLALDMLAKLCTDELRQLYSSLRLHRARSGGHGNSTAYRARRGHGKTLSASTGVGSGGQAHHVHQGSTSSVRSMQPSVHASDVQALADHLGFADWFQNDSSDADVLSTGLPLSTASSPCLLMDTKRTAVATSASATDSTPSTQSPMAKPSRAHSPLTPRSSQGHEMHIPDLSARAKVAKRRPLPGSVSSPAWI
ncbi:hypothetical protein FISHEDRAFT_72622 [Fistulina hepatica ATCC 64428]|nr:hypothetical protein FISHEDRAFT_72622 [Fistulina hepatica ATCC 64428]